MGVKKRCRGDQAQETRCVKKAKKHEDSDEPKKPTEEEFRELLQKRVRRDKKVDTP